MVDPPLEFFLFFMEFLVLLREVLKVSFVLESFFLNGVEFLFKGLVNLLLLVQELLHSLVNIHTEVLLVLEHICQHHLLALEELSISMFLVHKFHEGLHIVLFPVREGLPAIQVRIPLPTFKSYFLLEGLQLALEFVFVDPDLCFLFFYRLDVVFQLCDLLLLVFYFCLSLDDLLLNFQIQVFILNDPPVLITLLASLVEEEQLLCAELQVLTQPPEDVDLIGNFPRSHSGPIPWRRSHPPSDWLHPMQLLQIQNVEVVQERKCAFLVVFFSQSSKDHYHVRTKNQHRVERPGLRLVALGLHQFPALSSQSVLEDLVGAGKVWLLPSKKHQELLIRVRNHSLTSQFPGKVGRASALVSDFLPDSACELLLLGVERNVL